MYCDFMDEIADVWSVSLEEGQVLTASALSEDADLEIILVAPDGCMKGLAYSESDADCLGTADASCPSLEYTAASAGDYQLVVYADWCDGDMANYQLDAYVQ